MRPLHILVALQLSICSYSQSPTLLVNEVLASNRHAIMDDLGEYDDALELYNATEHSISLSGMKFVMNERSWTIPSGVKVPRKGHQVIWFDGQPEQGPTHAALKLPRQGATVLLVASDGITIMDVFTYPELPADVSYGRYPDGARDPGYFSEPTLGRPVQRGKVLAPPPASPQLTFDGGTGMLRMLADPISQIRYSTDGHDPGGPMGEEYKAPIPVQPGTVIRAIAVRPSSMPSKEELWNYRLETRAPKLPVASITISPDDLWADSAGINVSGSSTNYSRQGDLWQRAAWFGWNLDDTTHFSKVGIAVSGNGSRSLAKRNFKLMARSRFGSSDRTINAPGATISANEALLRADGTENAFLHNLFLNAVARAAGSRVDVREETVVDLELNGAYWGQYRLMPPKDAEWIMASHEVEAIDMLAGPSYRVVEGDRKAFREPLTLLSSLVTVDHLQQELREVVDLNSLMELAAFDLYSGRADHDLNVRCWRPRIAAGKWRWILYDMDLWAPADEATLQRMTSTAYYEAPYLRTIMENETLRLTFLARFAALLNTVLEPANAAARLDILYSNYAASMQRDQERWADEMNTPTAQEQYKNIRDFLLARSSNMFIQVTERYGYEQEEVTVRVNEKGAGTLLLDGLPLTDDVAVINGWSGVPVLLEAVPAYGMEFAGWKGIQENGPTAWLDPGAQRAVKAMFRKRSGNNGLQ